jgi:hypothetical protein
MARTEIVHADDVLRLGVSRNLLVCAWSSAPDLEHVRSLTRAVHALGNRYHDHRAILDLVVTGTPRFSDGVRDELVRFLRDPRQQGQGGAHVVAIGGIAGTTVRAFLSTVMLLARPTMPHKVFGDISSAATWLVPRLTTGTEAWTAAAVLTVAAEVTGAETTRASSGGPSPTKTGNNPAPFAKAGDAKAGDAKAGDTKAGDAPAPRKGMGSR